MEKLFPKPLPFKKMLGPSFIILALGLGSGEVILWPYLVSNYGLGIFWAAILGISCQYFINMEIVRYALIKGESVFVGLNQIFPWAPFWLIFSTFIGFGLPGIVAASAQVLASVLGIGEFKWIAISLLLAIGIMLSVSKVVYNLMERLTKVMIITGVSFIFILALYLATLADWGTLLQGLVGRGTDFWFIPEGINLAVFLAAFAYSGAGGNLSLTQSVYVREEGYGMGAYSQKLAGLFTNVKKKQTVAMEGHSFALTKPNIERFGQWWKKVGLEHLLVFWGIGSVAMALLMLLSFTTTFGLQGNTTGIHFVINEGAMLGQRIFPFVGPLFLVVVSLMLFQTQLGVLDSTSRIMAENVAVKKVSSGKAQSVNLSKIYFMFLWLQIGFGIILFLLDIHEPKSLIVTGAVINAVSMTVHIALVNIVNHRLLPKPLQALWWRKILMVIIFLVFVLFSSITLMDLFW